MALNRKLRLTGQGQDDALLPWLAAHDGISAATVNGDRITVTYDPQTITCASLVALLRGRGIDPATGLVTRSKIALFEIMDKNLADNADLPFGMDIELQRIYTRLMAESPSQPEDGTRS